MSLNNLVSSLAALLSPNAAGH